GDRLAAAAMPAAAVGEHDGGEVLLAGQGQIQFLLVAAVGIRDVVLDGRPRGRLGAGVWFLAAYDSGPSQQEDCNETRGQNQATGALAGHGVLRTRTVSACSDRERPTPIGAGLAPELPARVLAEALCGFRGSAKRLGLPWPRSVVGLGTSA